MKRLLNYLLLASMVSLFSAYQATAQDVSDEELYRYAMLMQVVDLMKADISAEVNDLIRNQDGITGKRYVELAKAGGSESKLKEMGAKDFEIQFMKQVDDLKSERSEAIKEVNSTLATKMVGERGKTYKKVKAAISEGGEVKSRYEAIAAKLASPEE